MLGESERDWQKLKTFDRLFALDLPLAF